MYLSKRKAFEVYQTDKNLLLLLQKLNALLAYIESEHEKGKSLKPEYSIWEERYRCYVQCEKNAIKIKVKNMKILNSHAQAFILLHIQFSLTKLAIVKSGFEVPAKGILGDRLYEKGLNEWEITQELMVNVCNLGMALKKEKNETFEGFIDSYDFMKKSAEDASGAEVVFKFNDEEIQKSYSDLLTSIERFLADEVLMQDVLNQHEVIRMKDQEIEGLIDLYKKLTKQQKDEYKMRFVEIFNTMEARVSRFLEMEEADTEQELNRKFGLLEERYKEKQAL